MRGIHVGGSAQTTASIDALFKTFKGFKIGGGYTFFDRNYAYYSLSGSNLSIGKEGHGEAEYNNAVSASAILFGNATSR